MSNAPEPDSTHKTKTLSTTFTHASDGQLKSEILACLVDIRTSCDHIAEAVAHSDVCRSKLLQCLESLSIILAKAESCDQLLSSE